MDKNILRQLTHKLLKPIIYIVYHWFIVFRLAGRQLQKLAEECKDDTERIVGLAFDFKYSYPFLPAYTVTPYQIREELAGLARVFKEKNPKYIMEIGTANGGTLFLWCRLSSDNASIISIDLPGGILGGDFHYWREPLYMDFKKPGQKLSLLREDSHSEKTLKQVNKLLKNNKIDFLFIDGDHGYEGVKRDFELYAPLVKNGGIIAFHDIVTGSIEATGGVPKFWNEIKHKYKSTEIVKDWSQGGCGIGVLSV
jgi:predicted O-methyltransferase YrrM